MKCKKYVWSVVPLVLVCVLLAANSVGGGANAQAPASQPPTCIPHPPGLVSWWPGDTNAQDVIGGNDGTLQNGATAGVALGKVGHAFSLDRLNNGFVNAGNGSNLKVSGGDFSVVAWVKFNTHDGDMSIVDKMYNNDPVVNENGWRLLKRADNHFWFCLGGGNSGDGCTSVSYTAVHSSKDVTADDFFYHVAAVKTSSTIEIYVNGMPDGTTPLGTFFDSDTADLLIGATASTIAPAFLNGQVDEVEIYNRALTDAEIYSIYNAGTAGQCKMVQWNIISLNNGSVGLGGLARADANDGSLIEFSGHGTFVLGTPDSPFGGRGLWKIEKEIAGVLTVLAHGKYEVESLVRFTEAPGAFPTARTDNIFVGREGDARAGLAVFRIRYADGSPGTLVVSCRLHGTPRNVFEGIAASKGAAGYFDPEEPVAGVDMNRTLFHIVVQ